jgi:hypothetical protein
LTKSVKLCHNCAMKSPFLLKKRGKYWHYRLANEKTFHTTGKTTKPRAIEFVQFMYHQYGNYTIIRVFPFDDFLCSTNL